MLKLKKILRRESRADSVLPDDMPAVLRRVYANRNISDQSELDYSVQGLLPFELLKGISAAAEIVAAAITQQQHIMIVGDYDADGATSTALVIRALRAFGLSNCSYLVPNRFEYGYGLTPAIVEVAQTRQPDLIITVDNGISSIEGVKTAQRHNIAVVITDHHLAGRELPQAAAIVNPNQPGCTFPEKSIAGVGVAFYLMLATRAALRDQGWFNAARAEPNMASLLDLVALGTVADVVPLEKNNRVMVQLGLQRIRRRQCSAGILALMQVAGKDVTQCTSQDFGFFVAPRLNAAGRLEDMSAGIECLLSDDSESALNLATQLHSLNQERRQIESEMLTSAMSALDELILSFDDKDLPLGLCLYDRRWHQGVVGLLASRIKDRFHRPVLAFANANGDEDSVDHEIKGSARSIPGLHIRDVLDTVATLHPGLIEKFGGHAMAAGLSLKKSNYETFKVAFEAVVASQLNADTLENIIYSDGPVATAEMTMNTAAALRLAGPWGQQFPEPVFDDVFEIVNWRIVGAKHLKLALRRPEAEQMFDAIAFNHTDSDLPEGCALIRAAYRMDVNEFRGVRKLQLIVDYIEAA